jgi:predicted metal-binding protein
MGKETVRRKPREIKRVVGAKELQEDLARYAQEAIKLGATDAKPIRAAEVVVDERVRHKCIIPTCPEYGMCSHCPPHALPVETVRGLVNKFQWALLMKIEVDPRLIGGYNAARIASNLAAGRKDPNAALVAEAIESGRRMYYIVSDIESMAFYDGHYMATGFACSSCRVVFCQDKGCQVLTQGGPCRFPLRSRPSMEASAMDVYRIVTNAGWSIYPLGMECDISEVKHGLFVGLVLIE